MAFATEQQVEDIAGVDLDTDRVTRLIALADQLIIEYLDGQTLAAATGTSTTLTGNGTTNLWLPQRPGTAVTSVTGANEGLVSTSYYELHDQGWSIVRTAGVWTDGEDYTVVYDHGFASIPAGVTLVVCDMIAAAVSTTPGVRQWSAGAYSETAANRPHAMALTAGHERTLDELAADLGLRPQSIGSIQIGAADTDWRTDAFGGADTATRWIE